MVELDEEREKFEVVCIRMSARLQGTDCVDLVPQTIVQCRGCWKGVCSFTWHQGRCIDDRIWTILPRVLVFTRFPPPFLSFKSISINIIFSLTIFLPTDFFKLKYAKLLSPCIYFIRREIIKFFGSQSSESWIFKKKKKERKQREEIKKFCHKNLASLEIGETIPYYYFISSLSLSRLPRYKVFKAVRRLWTSPRPSDPHVLLVIRLSWNLGGQLRDDKNGKRLKITLFLRYLTGNRK